MNKHNLTAPLNLSTKLSDLIWDRATLLLHSVAVLVAEFFQQGNIWLKTIILPL